ncbi:MAG: hypothetical protein J5819_06290 [Eubacterium sp.]|nr:hypothetical protein [Eubacterium sp.]
MSEILQNKDWKPLKIAIDDEKMAKIDLNKPFNFEIHEYKGELWTSGYVGVNRLRDRDENYIKDENDDPYLLQVVPGFDVDPFVMLDAVLKDEEYPAYAEKNKEDPLFKFYEREPLIETTKHVAGGQMLLAISFIRACEEICKKRIKNQMDFHEENLNGKIKGKILFNKHIRNNVLKGREDRVYCRYSTFSTDTVENQILKAALKRASRIMDSSTVEYPNIKSMIRYCRTILDGVRDVTLSAQLFGNAKTNGLFAYYKYAIGLARILYKDGSVAFDQGDDGKSIRIIPYMINMERLFELYVRSLIRKQLPENLRLYPFDAHISVYKGFYEKCHLSKELIPDIMIYEPQIDGDRDESLDEESLDDVKYVYDVKYKDRTRVNRNDTHQLLSYALLLNVDQCGFVFPKDDGSKDKNDGSEEGQSQSDVKSADSEEGQSQSDVKSSDSVEEDMFPVDVELVINSRKDIGLLKYCEYTVNPPKLDIGN